MYIIQASYKFVNMSKAVNNFDMAISLIAIHIGKELTSYPQTNLQEEMASFHSDKNSFSSQIPMVKGKLYQGF